MANGEGVSKGKESGQWGRRVAKRKESDQGDGEWPRGRRVAKEKEGGQGEGEWPRLQESGQGEGE